MPASTSDPAPVLEIANVIPEPSTAFPAMTVRAGPVKVTVPLVAAFAVKTVRPPNVTDSPASRSLLTVALLFDRSAAANSMLLAPANWARLFAFVKVTAEFVSRLVPVRSRLLRSVQEPPNSTVPLDNALRLSTTTIAVVIPVEAAWLLLPESSPRRPSGCP